jgi:hypothetical protein
MAASRAGVFGLSDKRGLAIACEGLLEEASHPFPEKALPRISFAAKIDGQ